MAKKIYIGAEDTDKNILPSGYTQLEYIESTGTQYINTGVSTSTGFRFVGRVKPLSSGHIYIGEDDEGYTDYIHYPDFIIGARGLGIGTMKSKWFIGTSQIGSGSDSVSGAPMTQGNWYKLDGKFSSRDYYLAVNLDNNTYVGAVESYPQNWDRDSIPDNLYLFTSNTTSNKNYTIKAQLSECKIYSQDYFTLVRNYIPCLNPSGEVGLYDLVTNQFYPNIGTGVFTAGPIKETVIREGSFAREVKKIYIGVNNSDMRDLPPNYLNVEYIESTGTQYIDTGFTPNQDTRIEFEFALVEAPDIRGGILGWNSNGQGNDFSLIYFFEHLNVFYGSESHVVADYTAEALGVKNKIDINKNVLTTDKGYNFTFPYTTFTAGSTLLLCTANFSGYPESYMTKIRVYSCKIYDNGTLIRDLVPCINPSGISGLYDVQNNQFYSNVSTNTSIPFVTSEPMNVSVAMPVRKAYIGVGGGATYREVEYIESNGAQYIDTNVIAKSEKFRVVADFIHTKSETGSFFGAENSGEYSLVSWLNSNKVNYAASTAGAVISEDGYPIGSRCILDLSVNNGTMTRILDGNVRTGLYSGNINHTLSMYIFGLNYNGNGGYYTSFKLFSMKIYDNDVLVRDFIPVLNSNGTAGLFDKVNKLFYSNLGSGNFTYGVETGRTYISNGVAKPCFGFGGKSLSYYGKITGLHERVVYHAATSVSNYALFGGGFVDYYIEVNDEEYEEYEYPSNKVTVYNNSLTRSSAPDLHSFIGGSGVSATSVGNRAIFASNGFDVYDATLTKIRTLASLGTARTDQATTTVDDMAILGGGINLNNGKATSICEAVNSALVRFTAPSLNTQGTGISTATVGDYAIFIGGKGNGGYPKSSTGNAMNSSLTKYLIHELSQASSDQPFAAVGDKEYGVYIYNNGTASIYDSSLTHVLTNTIMGTRTYEYGSSSSLDGYAIFLNPSICSQVLIFDDNLVQTIMPLSPSINGGYKKSAVINNFALFGGGGYSDYSINDVVVFTVV